MVSQDPPEAAEGPGRALLRFRGTPFFDPFGGPDLFLSTIYQQFDCGRWTAMVAASVSLRPEEVPCILTGSEKADSLALAVLTEPTRWRSRF